MLYTKLAKPVLFRMDPEKAHHLIIDSLSLAGKLPGMPGLISGIYGVPGSPELSMRLWDLAFPNPVGLPPV